MTRKEAIDIIKCLAYHARPNEEEIETAIKTLEQEPSIGYWIEHPHECGENWEYSMYECTNCHGYVDSDYDYCPYCGAEMEET